MSPERTSMTLRPGSIGEVVALGEGGDGLHQPLEGAGRVVHATGVHRDREALLLDVRTGGAGAAQHGRQLALEARQPRGRPRRADALLGGRPALVAVLAEDEELGTTVEHGVAERVEVAHRDGLARRATGDHRDRAHHLGELEQRAGGRGVQAGRLGVVDDRRQRAVEVEAHDHAVEDVAYGVVVGARVVGGELHGPTQPRAAHVRRPCPGLHRAREGREVSAGRRP